MIIGTGYNAKVAYDDLMRNRTLGMDVMGYVQVNGKSPEPETGIEADQVIGHLDDIDDIINKNQIQDVLVAIEPDRRGELVEVISKVDKPDITLKLLPDFHQLVSGLNKTNQIFGLPFIEISPQPMPLWERNQTLNGYTCINCSAHFGSTYFFGDCYHHQIDFKRASNLCSRKSR